MYVSVINKYSEKYESVVLFILCNNMFISFTHVNMTRITITFYDDFKV